MRIELPVGFLISSPRRGAEGGEGGMRLRSGQPPSVRKWCESPSREPAANPYICTIFHKAPSSFTSLSLTTLNAETQVALS